MSFFIPRKPLRLVACLPGVLFEDKDEEAVLAGCRANEVMLSPHASLGARGNPCTDDAPK